MKNVMFAIGLVLIFMIGFVSLDTVVAFSSGPDIVVVDDDPPAKAKDKKAEKTTAAKKSDCSTVKDCDSKTKKACQPGKTSMKSKGCCPSKSKTKMAKAKKNDKPDKQ